MHQSFPLQEGEHLVLMFRKHWIVLLSRTLGIILATMLPLALYGYLAYAGVIHPANYATHVFFFAGIWWLLIMWWAFAIVFTDYFLDMWIITNRRIMRIEQLGFFDRNVSAWGIERIEEATVHTKNIFGTLLGYGSLEIKTAGSPSAYAKADWIPDPEGVREIIMEGGSRIATLERERNGQ